MVRDKNGTALKSNFYIVNGNTKQVVSIPHNDSQQKCNTLEEMRDGFWTSATIVLGEGFGLWWNSLDNEDFELCKYRLKIYTYNYAKDSKQQIDKTYMNEPVVYVRFVSSPQDNDTSVTPAKKYANVKIYASNNESFTNSIHLATFKLYQKDFGVWARKIGSTDYYYTHCFVEFTVNLNYDATKISVSPGSILWATTPKSGSISDNPSLSPRTCETKFIKIDDSLTKQTASFNISSLNTTIENFSKRTNLELAGVRWSNQFATSVPKPPLFYFSEERIGDDAPTWPFRSRGVESVSFIYCAK